MTSLHIAVLVLLFTVFAAGVTLGALIGGVIGGVLGGLLAVLVIVGMLASSHIRDPLLRSLDRLTGSS